MARMMLALAGDGFPAAFLLVAVGLFITVLVLALVALCAKRKLSSKNHHRVAEELGAEAAIGDQGRKADAGDRGGIGYGEEEGFGKGGLWQKSILMGDKCRPLEFSGVIYYDDGGNRVPEMPRSPNVAPAPASSPLRSFTFPMSPPLRHPSY